MKCGKVPQSLYSHPRGICKGRTRSSRRSRHHHHEDIPMQAAKTSLLSQLASPLFVAWIHLLFGLLVLAERGVRWVKGVAPAVRSVIEPQPSHGLTIGRAD